MDKEKLTGQKRGRERKRCEPGWRKDPCSGNWKALGHRESLEGLGSSKGNEVGQGQAGGALRGRLWFMGGHVGLGHRGTVWAEAVNEGS